MAMEAQPEDRGVTVMERVRAVHLRMVDAVLGGDGLEGVATLAAGETGGVVAIVVPRLGAAAASAPVAELSALRRYVGERARGRAAGVPPGVVAEVPIATGDEQLGAVLLLGDDDPAAGRARVPARRRGGLPDRGRGRGGPAGGRAEPARLVPGGAARA